MTGYDHDRDRRIVALHLLEDVDPVEPAVLQPDIEDDQIRRARVDRREGGVAVPGHAHAMALVLENVADKPADVGLVVHYQNVGPHMLSLNFSAILLRASP